jgi:hypothetical protein
VALLFDLYVFALLFVRLSGHSTFLGHFPSPVNIFYSFELCGLSLPFVLLCFEYLETDTLRLGEILAVMEELSQSAESIGICIGTCDMDNRLETVAMLAVTGSEPVSRFSFPPPGPQGTQVGGN